MIAIKGKGREASQLWGIQQLCSCLARGHAWSSQRVHEVLSTPTSLQEKLGKISLVTPVKQLASGWERSPAPPVLWHLTWGSFLCIEWKPMERAEIGLIWGDIISVVLIILPESFSRGFKRTFLLVSVVQCLLEFLSFYIGSLNRLIMILLKCCV